MAKQLRASELRLEAQGRRTAIRSFCLGIAATLALGSLSACQQLGAHEGASLADCGIAVPPVDAGEMGSHGSEMRIFPRSNKMPGKYSGCQSVWEIRKDGTASKIIEAQYIDGAVVRFTDFTPKPGSVPKVCNFQDGKPIGPDKTCPSFEQANERQKSFPPGCLAKIASSTLESDHPCFQQLR